ncbi:MAG: T9SS type A sorting domain-containing protein [Rhodothermales bacterium]
MRIPLRIGIVLLWIAAAGPATGQVVTLIETDKAVYEYGEPIELQFTITNNTDEGFTIWSSSGCQAWFQFDKVTPSTVCTADDVPHYFPPNGSFKRWTWTIDPQAIGLPESGGAHTIVAYYGDYRDSLTIEAPAFLGGQIEVVYPANAPADSIASLRSRFDATVVGTFSTNPVLQVWEIRGTALTDVLAALETSPYLSSVEAYRRIYYTSIVANESDPELPARIEISSPYPNPFADRTTFDIQTREAGPVRAVLYDLLGRERRVLFDGYLPAGAAQVVTIEAGDLPAGVYVYRVDAAGGVVAGKVVLRR